MENIGDFQYDKKDLIGHGAFAVVFKGRSFKVSRIKLHAVCNWFDRYDLAPSISAVALVFKFFN